MDEAVRQVANLWLFGDSVIDNTAYVPEGKDTASQLRELLPSHTIHNKAVDGMHAYDFLTGIGQKNPHPVEHAVLSIGGNDALQAAVEETGGYLL